MSRLSFLLVSLSLAAQPVLGVDFRRGDANVDGVVDMADGLFIIRHLFLGGPASTCLSAEEIDGNGVVELTDAINLFGWLFLGNPSDIRPPGPFIPGPDPGPFPIGCDAYSPSPPPKIADLVLGFAGFPAEISGSPGEVKTFDLYATLTTSENTSPDGPEGWSIGMSIDGGTIEGLALKGVTVSTIYEGDPSYEQDLGGSGLFFNRAEPSATHEDDPARKGAFSAVILLKFNKKMVLQPSGTQRIARITVKTTIQEPCEAVVLRFEDGFKDAASQPVANRVIMDGKDQDPRLGSCVIPVLCSPTLLTLDEPAHASLSLSLPEKLYRLSAPQGESVLITLSDPDPADASSLYVRWGDFPKPYRFDLAAAGGESEQRLLIPYFLAGEAYLLLTADRVNGPSSEVTLLATAAGLSLEAMSASSSGEGGSGLLSASISGSGFRPDTAFRLASRSDGSSVVATEQVRVSANRAEAVFPLAGASPGRYDLRASNPGGGAEAVLADAFEVQAGPPRGPVLKVVLGAPERYRYDRLARVTLHYENTGDEEMTAPLFKVVGPPETDLRLESQERFQGNAIQVMGIDPGGVAGKLPPGFKGEIPILFQNRSADRAAFKVFLFSPNREDYVSWQSVGAPPEMGSADWEALWPHLSVKLGASWIEYREALAARATRLARRGVDASSVEELFRFAAREALGRPTSAAVGRLRDPSSGSPLEGVGLVAVRSGSGIAAAVGRTVTGGLFAIDGLRAGESYDLRLAGGSATIAAVTPPAGGDSLGLEPFAAAAPGAPLPPCADCVASGLPSLPLLPPDHLFVEVDGREVAVLSSFDPNEKDGPTGELGPADDLLYSIYFENLPTATAWAQKVEVADQLDPDLDWSTFRLRGAVAGGSLFIPLDREDGPGLPPLNEGQSAGRVFEAMGQSGQWLLHSYCEYDPRNGLARWVFQTLDPATGLPPDPSRYPDAGFLPPNDGAHRGEGHVDFVVLPLPGVDDDTEVTNEASITFDDRLPPLPTNVTTNRIRVSPPPEVPRNPFPPSGVVHAVETNSALSWRSDAASYTVSLRAAGEPEPGTAFPTSESRLRPSLQAQTVYTWKVSATRGGITVDGPPWTFRTVDPPPALPETPMNVSPPAGAVDLPQHPQLLWTPAAGASAYQVFLWTHGGPRPAEPVVTGITVTGHRVLEVLDHGTTYDWKVEALNRSGKTEGAASTFTIKPALFRRGDANSDGGTDISDPIFMISSLFLGGDPPKCEKSTDANDDGAMDVSDAVYLINSIFLGGPLPPEPLLICGLDAKADDLTCRSFPACSQ